jgi:hypothetical protein
MQMGTIESVWRYPVKGMPADEPSLRSDEIAGSASPRSALDRAARSGVDREVRILSGAPGHPSTRQVAGTRSRRPHSRSSGR